MIFVLKLFILNYSFKLLLSFKILHDLAELSYNYKLLGELSNIYLLLGELEDNY